jgi:O-methyltransferase
MLRRLLGVARERRRQAVLTGVSRRVRAERLTYLRPERLHTLERLAGQVNREAIAGDFMEAGIALGGSAIVMATLMGENRSFHGYDVFGMIPAPGEEDPTEAHERYAVITSGGSRGIGDSDTYYGYRADLYDDVAQTFARYDVPVDGERVQLHRGLFEDTLHPSRPVALAHIDSDWYDPVTTCLTRIAPVLSPGGYIVLDDYFDYGGCRKAVDEFLAAHPGFRIAEQESNVALQRLPDAET